MKTTGSFDRIDYSLRPAKHAERRMLSEVFRRLRPFGRIEDYRYVGMGSLWFSDFRLFHRTLGIKQMLSIEADQSQQPRFEENKPFAAIEMDFRSSSNVVPGLGGTQPAIVWLDYDDPIAKGMLLDVQTVSQAAVSGTVLAITVQLRAQEAPRPNQEDGVLAIDRFKERLGIAAVPGNATEESLLGWSFGKLSRDIFTDQIEASLAVRNLEETPEARMSFKPICEIEYMDGAKMTTLVGLFAKASDESLVQECSFDTLDFLPDDSRLLRIEIPKLTVREIRELERQLPLTAKPLEYGSIPQDHADNFTKFYRYLPNFAVLEQ